MFDDAGRLRTSDTTRGVTDDTALARSPQAFFPAALCEIGVLNIATELAESRNLQALYWGVFAHRLAHVYDEFGYLHPFRGGNGMTLRMFASRL